MSSSLEEERDAGPAEPYLSETASLSGSRLQRLPKSLLNNGRLKYLYLEGNQIGSLPHCLFPSLPSLLWLDLRNNQIASLPAEIGSHRSLQTLLLEGNPIAELPPELGNVISLRGLSLRNCPVTFPPPDVVREGLRCILRYLRAALAQRPLSARRPAPELPEVEKLQLSELAGSTAKKQHQSQDKDELQRCLELKEGINLPEKAEPELVCMGPRDRRPPVTKKKKVATKAGIIPKLGPSDTRQQRRADGRRQTVTQEIKEREAVIQQRRKSEEALREWRSQAKILQEKKTLEQQRRLTQTCQAEFNSKPSVKDSCDSPQTQACITQRESGRSARELERLIRAHVEKMQERRRNPRGSASEQVAAARQDVEEMRRLQSQLLEGRRERQKCSPNHTGDTWQSFLEK